MARLYHISLNKDQSQEFVDLHHRHSKPLKRHMFSIGVVALNDRPVIGQVGLPDIIDELLGVATVDHCSSKYNQRRDHIEIRRVCVRPDVDAGDNVASFLIGKACQSVFAMGYKVAVTYSQPHESGTSLRAAGFYICNQARMTKYTNGKIEGGLVTWIKGFDSRPSKRERENTSRILEGNRTFLNPKRS
jgi:hypothetical protein